MSVMIFSILKYYYFKKYFKMYVHI